MSFALTKDQIRNRTKTVTRRFGWWFLHSGYQLNAVEKSMGLKKGETIIKLAEIRVISTRREPLSSITKEDCAREGFPDYSPQDFIDMLMQHYKNISPTSICNRIEFEYLDPQPEIEFFDIPNFLLRKK